MKEVKEFFENASPQTTAEQSISVPRTLRRVLLLGLLLSGLGLRSALAAGPTGWGIGSCREVTAFPANLVDPGVYCLSYKHIDFPLMSGVLIKISANNVVLDLNGATLDGTPKRNGAFPGAFSRTATQTSLCATAPSEDSTTASRSPLPLGTSIRPCGRATVFWWRMSGSSRTGPREWRLSATIA